MILSHCTRNAASRLQCERIIKIYKVLICPLTALTIALSRGVCVKGPLGPISYRFKTIVYFFKIFYLELM